MLCRVVEKRIVNIYKSQIKLASNSISVWPDSMPVSISTHWYMHFYLVTFKIVTLKPCVENYQNKNSTYDLSSTFSSFFTQLKYTILY